MPPPPQTQFFDMSAGSIGYNGMSTSDGSRFCTSGHNGCANLRAETEFLPDNPRCSYCRHTAVPKIARKRPAKSDPFPALTKLAASFSVPEGSDLIWCVGIDHKGARPRPSREFRPREPYPCEDHRGNQSWRIRRDILCDACRENRDPVTGKLNGVPIARVHYMPTDYFCLTRSKKMDWWYLAIKRAALRCDPRAMALDGCVLELEEALGEEPVQQQQQQQQHDEQEQQGQDEDTMMTDATSTSIFSSAATPSTCFATPTKQQSRFVEINMDDIDAYTDEQWNAALALMEENLVSIESSHGDGLFESEDKQQSEPALAVSIPADQQYMRNAWETPEHDKDFAQLASLQAYVQCSDQDAEIKPDLQGAEDTNTSIQPEGSSISIKDEDTSLAAPAAPKDSSLVADDGNLPLKRTSAPPRIKRIIESLLSEELGLVCMTCGEEGRVELLFRGFVMSDYDAALRPDWRQCLCCLEANPRP